MINLETNDKYILCLWLQFNLNVYYITVYPPILNLYTLFLFFFRNRIICFMTEHIITGISPSLYILPVIHDIYFPQTLNHQSVWLQSKLFFWSQERNWLKCSCVVMFKASFLRRVKSSPRSKADIIQVWMHLYL